MIDSLTLPPDSQLKSLRYQKYLSLDPLSKGMHSFRTLGLDYAIDIEVEYIPNARLVLFNKDLAQDLDLDLPESDEELEKVVLNNFAWFKSDHQTLDGTKSKITKTFFSTRYKDSDDKSEGSALGDGRATWVGEIIKKLDSGKLQYFDIVLKGTGTTELAWFNHPNKNHKDGQVSLTEAVHEYIYSLAANTNGIDTAGILAVIELPFYREVNNEKAAIIVRVGNHLRFGHYRYFSDNHIQLKKLFEYGLKRDMGLSLAHSVNAGDVRNYLDLVVSNSASSAAIYFDIHAVHGSPTFGNITTCGRTIDLSTFVYIDAHHGNYSYMSGGANLLGGVWGQTEQFFNLFSGLVDDLKSSDFDYSSEILPVEYFLRKFSDTFEHVLTNRWLKRVGLSEEEINSLSTESKESFYEIVKLIYELKGSKKIKLKQRKILLAAFEPRNILSETANYIDSFDNVALIWERLFKVNRSWGTYKQADAIPYIDAYRKSVINIRGQLKASKDVIAIWQQRSKAISLSERNEPGKDFFYDSERFFASKDVLHQIKLGNVSWRKIDEMAKISAAKLVDHGF